MALIFMPNKYVFKKDTCNFGSTKGEKSNAILLVLYKIEIEIPLSAVVFSTISASEVLTGRDSSAIQSQKAVTAYLKSKQLLLSGFARQNSDPDDPYRPGAVRELSRQTQRQNKQQAAGGGR